MKIYKNGIILLYFEGNNIINCENFHFVSEFKCLIDHFFYIYGRNKINIKNCKILQNKYINKIGGFLYLKNENNLTINFCKFSKILSKNYSLASILIGVYKNNIKFIYCTFENFQSSQSIIKLNYLNNITIMNFSLLNTTGSRGIFINVEANNYINIFFGICKNMNSSKSGGCLEASITNIINFKSIIFLMINSVFSGGLFDVFKNNYC